MLLLMGLSHQALGVCKSAAVLAAMGLGVFPPRNTSSKVFKDDVKIVL